MPTHWGLTALCLTAASLPLLAFFVFTTMLPGIPQPKAWMGIGALAMAEVVLQVFTIWNWNGYWPVHFVNVINTLAVLIPCWNKLRLHARVWRFRGEGVRSCVGRVEIHDLMVTVARAYPRVDVTVGLQTPGFMSISFGKRLCVMVGYNGSSQEMAQRLINVHPQDQLGFQEKEPDWLQFKRGSTGRVWLSAHRASPLP